jgi:hypothetical protein
MPAHVEIELLNPLFVQLVIELRFRFRFILDLSVSFAQRVLTSHHARNDQKISQDEIPT